VTPPAIRILESPDAFPADAAAALQAGPGDDPARWLALVSAALYVCPELVADDVAANLGRLIAKPDLDGGTRDSAGQVLSLAVPFAASAVAAATGLIATRGLPDTCKRIAIEALRVAVFWRIEGLDLEAVIAAAEAETFGPIRGGLLEGVIEPTLLAEATPQSSLVERAARLHVDENGRKHFLYWLRGKAGIEPGAGTFAWHKAVLEGLGPGRRRALIVHNINDGQGDEIARTGALVQALLDFNRELDIAIVTRRLHLYSHPRVAAVPIGDRERVQEGMAGPFDAVIDFFEPEIQEVDYDPVLERAVEELRVRHRPFLDVRSRKGFNHFLFETVRIEGQEVAASMGIDRRRIANNYDPAMRLIAELGLPARRGEQTPGSEPAFAGRPWSAAEAFWNGIARGGRLALLAPFGGAERLKGFTDPEAISAEILRLAGEGFRVVVMPTGASWGTSRAAEEAIALLPQNAREAAAVGPAPDSPAGTIPRDESLSFADSVMRLTLFGIRAADVVVTVEGWMAHAAHSFGKPYRVLMLPYSHGPEWLPYGRSTRQTAVLAARAAAARIEAPLIEQPRKQALLFTLRDLRREPAAAALGAIRGALASEDRDVRLAAAEALAAQPGPEAAATLAELLSDPSHLVRAAAAGALLDRRVIPSGVDEQALLAHVWMGPMNRDWGPILRLRAGARPALETAVQGDDPVVRREAARALRLLDFKPEAKQPRAGKLAQLLGPMRHQAAEQPAVLILTPVKDAAAFIPGYYKRITRLTYPPNRISIGFLEGDSRDGTYDELKDRLPRFRKRFRRAGLWKRDFGFRIPENTTRWAEHLQAERRAVLARSRNHLLFRALDDEDWVLWLDADVIEFPGDIIEKLLATGKDIVQPHCVVEEGGPTFDRNAWRNHGKLMMEDMRQEGELVELDAVGGTMLLVRADLHREGLIFPPAPYGRRSALAREGGELETEGLGILARDMGYRCWGMPRLEIKHVKW
jgi:Anp1/HEAT repeats